MKVSADFRRSAREALRGKWGIAVLAGVIASILGHAGSLPTNFKLSIDLSEAGADLAFAGQKILSTNPEAPTLLSDFYELSRFETPIWILSALTIIGVFFLSSIIYIGYSRFQLELYRSPKPEISHLFAYFPHWKTAVTASLLQALYVLLWSLLLIPGILAAYNYAMTGFILAENPELSANEAISLSKAMMYGHRWRYFCLEISFIGWDILALFTAGVGNLWLAPYKNAASAAFYSEISQAYYASLQPQTPEH